MRAMILTCVMVSAATALAPAADWYIALDDPNEVVTQTTDRVVDGDLYILNNGRLNVDGATITMHGDVYVTNSGTLDVNRGSLRFVQAYSYQRQIIAAEAATLRVVDSIIDGDGRSYGVSILGTANVTYDRVTVETGFSTWAFWDDAVLDISGCVNTGEFVPLGQNTLAITDSDIVLFWLVLPDGSVVDATLPPPGDVTDWSVGPNSSWAEGIPYTATLGNCTGVMWGTIARSGSAATFRDSTLRVVGSLFDRSNEIAIRGVANNRYLNDAAYQWGDVSLHFVNCDVRTWNYYCYGTTKLTLESCLFGELLADEQGEAWVTGSLCDGSGGYMGAFSNAQLWMFRSTNLSQTTSAQNAFLFAAHSALLSPTIDATGNSVMALLNTEYLGDPCAHDSAVLFDAAIDPVEAGIGKPVALRGTARMLTGPTSPWVYEGYSLEYGEGAEPNEWYPIGGPFGETVRDGTLGRWDTRGLRPGTYTVQLSVHHNAGDPATVSSPAALAPLPSIGTRPRRGAGGFNPFSAGAIPIPIRH